MKLTQYKKFLLTAFTLANGFFAAAQSSNVPGPGDYEKFSPFITQRNIFDPNRYPRYTSNRPSNYHPRVSRAAPAFTLVGTMSYEKGMFAFFDGNSSDLRKILPESGGIAGYTVTEITLTGVKLQSADKKETVQMKIGEMMRQEGNHWLPAGEGELAAIAGNVENSTPAATGNSASDASSAPSATLEANDILKKLMQQKKQEEQGLK